MSLSLEGSVARVIFRSAKTSYSIIEIKLERIAGDQDSVRGSKKYKLRKATIVGPCALVEKGSFVRATGQWIETARHGLQLKASSISQVAPTSGDACKRYLRNFPGLGPKRAADIVSAFPEENVFEILDKEPERLLAVRGIGENALKKLREAWRDRKSLYDASEFLHSVGIGPAIAERLVESLGGTVEKCAQAVQSDPYRVVAQSHGLLSFNHADDIAMKHLKVVPSDERRIREGLVATTKQLARGGGHTCVSVSESISATLRALGLESESQEMRQSVQLALKTLLEEGDRLFSVDQGLTVSPRELFEAEKSIAISIQSIAAGRHPLPYVDPETFVRQAEKSFGGSRGLRLAPMQAEAVRQAMQSKVLIITGGPGVGKTTAISSIVTSFRRMGMVTVVASPTGRASAKLAQVTGQKASTIHRLLEYDPDLEDFKRNASNKLQGHLFLVDEASMIDVELAAAFLAAIPETAVLVLVGDVDQLPAVGPGNVLQDLVACEKICTVRLDRNYRQQEQTSHIVRAAHSMLRGDRLQVMPYHVGSGLESFEEFISESDLRFISAPTPLKIVSSVVRVMDDLQTRFKVNPVDDVQVLTAMRKGPIGSRAFNGVLQNHFNRIEDVNVENQISPLQDPSGVYAFRIGDKVMQVVNDYYRDVFNGEIGRVAGISPVPGSLQVRFPTASSGGSRIVEYTLDELRDIEPAFACTIHKSQGCEFPVAIVPVHSDYSRVLQRNLLYTGITRGAMLTILVGDMHAVDNAIAKTDARSRKSHLKTRLLEERFT